LYRLIPVGALLLLACGSPVPPSPSPKASPTTTASASPSALSCANVPPVYHPARLKLLDACATFKGLVIADLHELDGDRHLWIEPDAGYEGLLNAANDYHGHKALVAEIVPACTTEPASAAAAARCPASKIPGPAVGAHVLVTGPHVLDTNHGWNEIHPVASLQLLKTLFEGDPDDDA